MRVQDSFAIDQIYHLNNQFGTLVAWKQNSIHCRTFGRWTILIHNCIHFCVAHIGILIIHEIIRTFTPRQHIVRTPIWHSVVSGSNNYFIFVNNHSPNLNRQLQHFLKFIPRISQSSQSILKILLNLASITEHPLPLVFLTVVNDCTKGISKTKSAPFLFRDCLAAF